MQSQHIALPLGTRLSKAEERAAAMAAADEREAAAAAAVEG